MKLSRKMKIYSSLASFAVLGGVAITAASCADTSETEKSSSPTTDNKEPASSEGSGTPASTKPVAKPGEAAGDTPEGGKSPEGTQEAAGDTPEGGKSPEGTQTGMLGEDGKDKENFAVHSPKSETESKEPTKLDTNPLVDHLGDTGTEAAKPVPDQTPS